MRDPTLWISRMHPADRERMIHAETNDLTAPITQGRWEYRLIAETARVVRVIDDEAVIGRDVDGGRSWCRASSSTSATARTSRSNSDTRPCTIR